MKISTKTMAIGGIFAAMVTVGTMVIRIPIPVGGYIHIGDSLVYLSGILLGPLLGGVVSAIGSGIADLFGYIDYAPATVVIKFADAFVTAAAFLAVKKHMPNLMGTILGYLLGVALGGTLMVGGYFGYEVLLKGFTYALGSVSFNVAQAVGGAIIGLPVLIALEKTKYFSQLNQLLK